MLPLRHGPGLETHMGSTAAVDGPCGRAAKHHSDLAEQLRFHGTVVAVESNGGR